MYAATKQNGVKGQENTHAPLDRGKLSLQAGRPAADFVFTPFYTPSIVPVHGETCLAFLFVNTTGKKIQVSAFHFYDFECPPDVSIEPYTVNPKIRCTVQPQSYAHVTFRPKIPKRHYFRDEAGLGDYASLIRVGYFFGESTDQPKVDDQNLIWVEGRAPIKFI